jgi:hypothetical protein
MSENSGPAGQGTLPSTPKPKSTSTPKWNAETSARTGSYPMRFGGTATNRWSTSPVMSPAQIRDREGHMGVYSTGRFTFSTTSDTFITSVDADQSGTVLEQTALLGDPSNRKYPWLTSSNTIYNIEGAASQWITDNNGKDIIGQTRSKFIALGRITGEDAKVTGNGIDPALRVALSQAVYDISVVNYNRMAVGDDLLSMNEGLLSLAPAPATKTSGGSGGPGGTYTDTTRQIFKSGDYRVAVDQAYRDITGQAADEKTLDQFVAVLQRMDDKNPQKTVRKVSNNGKVTNTVQSGGVSQAEAEDQLKQMALQDPETEQYQKATTFMNMFDKAIAAKVQLNNGN